MPSRTDSRPREIEIPGLIDERPHRRRRIVLSLLVVFGLLFLDAVWVIVRVRSGMERAQAELEQGADALTEGDVDLAGSSFADADGAASDANELLHHPAALVAGVLPWVGDDVGAVERLVDSAALAADAGTTLTGAARKVGWQGGTLAGLSQGADSLAATLEDAGSEITTAAIGLREAASILIDQTTVGLIGPVRTAVVAGRAEVVERAGLLQSASDLAEVVPALFQNGRRYLLVVQNPNEPRGTGGYMGYMGFLESQNGDLELERFFRTPATLATRPVTAPTDYTNRYGRFGALQDLRLANLSPDLPTTAEVTLQLAEEMGWGSFDGILMVDPVWMRYMLESTGPVETPGWPDAITAENVVRVLGRDVFLLESGAASDTAQDQIGTAVWEAVQKRDVSGAAMAEALARASAERHLQVYSVHPQEQTILSRLDVAGEATLGRNPLAVAWTALNQSKVGYFTERSTDVVVTLDQDGTAFVTTTLRVRNEAPDGPPGLLLGDGTDVPVGTWRALASVYMPREIVGAPSVESSVPGFSGQATEFDHAVGFGEVTAAAGRTTTWSVTYVAPDAVISSEGGSEYRLDFLPQAGLSPQPLSVRIQLPLGMSTTGTSPGMRSDGQSATYEGEPTTPQALWVRFT